jgi:site-specific DNA-adenine methylase
MKHDPEYIEVYLPDAMVTYAAAALAVWWMGRNGEAGTDKDWAQLREQTGSFCHRWTDSGGDPAVRWQAMKDSIPQWWKLLTDGPTTFLNRDALEILPEIPDEPGVFIYADPPYLQETRGSARYAVEVEDATGGFREADDFHAKLADGLHRFKTATVVVSYYAHERLKRLYPADGWDHLDATKAKATAHASGETAQSPEVLIVKRP